MLSVAARRRPRRDVAALRSDVERERFSAWGQSSRSVRSGVVDAALREREPSTSTFLPQRRAEEAQRPLGESAKGERSHLSEKRKVRACVKQAGLCVSWRMQHCSGASYTNEVGASQERASSRVHCAAPGRRDVLYFN